MSTTLNRKSSTPGPPYSSGTAIARKPCAAALVNSSRGTISAFSQSGWGMTSWPRNLRNARGSRRARVRRSPAWAGRRSRIGGNIHTERALCKDGCPMAGGHQAQSQEERRAETRAKLLDATIECLLEEGYAGTTTRRVAELAGVSQGAQTHHFPYRVDLVAAAIERLAQHGRRVSAARGRLARGSEERVGRSSTCSGATSPAPCSPCS